MNATTDSVDSGLRTGLYFGVTSGVITTLGLLTGLHAGTGSVLAVVGGIVTIAIADALSDALGVHIAKEAEPGATGKEIWTATIATFCAKFVVAMTFVVPVLLLPLESAVIAALVWGFLVLGALSFFLARSQGTSPVAVIGEHTVIAAAVVVIAHFVGRWINATLG